MDTRVALLWDKRLQSPITEKEIEAITCELRNQGFSCHRISPKDLIDRHEVLDGVRILVNAMGKGYPEEGFTRLYAFYQDGGCILSLTPYSFTTPFVLEGEHAVFRPNDLRALHTLRLIDKWVATGDSSGQHTVCTHPRYAFITENDLIGSFSESCSAVYRFADEQYEPDSRLTVCCQSVHEDGRVLGAPVVRIDHDDYGTLAFINVLLAKNYFATEKGLALIRGLAEELLWPRVFLSVSAGYGRYSETETPELTIVCEHLHTGMNNVRISEYLLEARAELPDGTVLDEASWCIAAPDEKRFSPLVWRPDISCTGEIDVFVTLSWEGGVLDEYRTGFYRLSDADMERTLASFVPVKLDSSVSTDFCVRAGRPFPMHGTNYFVTDAFRRCFENMNVLLCRQEMAQIVSAGINILRTGIWVGHDLFYSEDGFVSERAARNLQAFLLTAVKFDLPVQFVLGASTFDHWDRSRCYIHDPYLIKRARNAFGDFARRFKSFPNVMVDAINEPSYSSAGAWRLGRPSGSPYEKEHWHQWLRKKYNDDLSALRRSWRRTDAEISSFAECELPDKTLFEREYNRTYGDYPVYASVNDFFAFARESFNQWLDGIYHAVKDIAPDMIFMMGRDEELRIPAEQDMAHAGLVQMINIHQWNKNAAMFTEYVFNRIKGMPCCGQEMGTYPYFGPDGEEITTEEDCRRLLDRKLAYSFGNWLQWQYQNDPKMGGSHEVDLGLLRADKTETPSMELVRLNAFIDEKMAEYLTGRDDEASGIVMLHPTSFYFSCDSDVAMRAAVNSVLALHYRCGHTADMVLEHIFASGDKKQVGRPDLMIVPCAHMLSDAAFERLMHFAEAGGTVLLSGGAWRDEHCCVTDRLMSLFPDAAAVPMRSRESFILEGRETEVTFYGAVEKWRNTAAVFQTTLFSGVPEVKTRPLGKGTLIVCPVPVEMSDCPRAIEQLYSYALRVSGTENRVMEVGKKNAGILIYPMVYDRATLYTFANEGRQAAATVIDRRTGVKIEVTIPAERSARVWIDDKGNLLGGCLFGGSLRIGDTTVEPGGELAFCMTDFSYMAGRRENEEFIIGGKRWGIKQLFHRGSFDSREATV